MELMGRDAVRIKLSQMLPDRSAAFKLPDQPSCKRGFAADWLARMEVEDRAKAAAEKVTEAKRYRHGIAVAVLGVVVAIAIAWWFNK